MFSQRFAFGAATFAALSVLALTPAVSQAQSITYQVGAIASGTLGGTPFTGATLLITAVGDAGAVVDEGGGLYTNLTAATVTIGGLGTATFTSPFAGTFSNQAFSGGVAGFLIQGQGTVLATVSSAFATYDLTTEIGPVVDDPFFRDDLLFATSAGDLNITQAGISTFVATFTATSAPEPATLALLGTVTLPALAIARRKPGSVNHGKR